ncbi:MAG: sialate O-acetylesterase [Phycisphaeraceae bacterium]
MSKPVQVYILLGQSNMVGSGLKGKWWRGEHAVGPGTLHHAVRKEGLYPFMLGEDVNGEPRYSTRADARYTFVMGNSDEFDVKANAWLSANQSGSHRIGPEYGIGWHLAEHHDEPVLILKSCIGNRSIGWDLLSPSSKAYEYDGVLNPGYGEVPKTAGTGTRPDDAGWYAGIQYDADVMKAKRVLENLDEFYPGAAGYEVAGFFFWQGTKDVSNDAHATHYEKHMANFIRDIRKEFDAHDAPFVIATLAQSKLDENGNYLHEDAKMQQYPPERNPNAKLVLQAQLAVDGDSGKYPEFKGSVKTLYAYPLSRGGSSGGHYNNDARTYMNVGLGMGETMLELLKER